MLRWSIFMHRPILKTRAFHSMAFTEQGVAMFTPLNACPVEFPPSGGTPSEIQQGGEISQGHLMGRGVREYKGGSRFALMYMN